MKKDGHQLEQMEEKPLGVTGTNTIQSHNNSSPNPSLLQPPPSSHTATTTPITGGIPTAPAAEIVSRPPSPALSNSRLSVNTITGKTKTASIYSRLSSRPGSTHSRLSSRPGSIQHVAATAAALMQNAEARRIRMDLYSELVNGWYHLSTSSKILLIYYLVVTMVEVLATITVSVIERKNLGKCFYLVIFLALYLIRAITISVMLLRRFLYDRPHDLPRDVGGACSAHYKTMINWASLILLLFSVSLLTTQSHCAQTSPGLFYLVLVLSLLGYLCLTALLILWFFVLFCLNGLVAVLELFGVGSRVMQWQGATPEMIDNIPITKFTRRIQPTITPQEQEQQHQQPLSQTVKDPETVAMPSIVVSDEGIGSYSTRLEELSSNVVIEMEPSTEPAVEVQHKQAQEQEQEQGREQDKEKEKEQEEENEHPTQMLSLEHLSPEERELALRISTSCPICLCDYEDLEELRHLPCDHFFHKECVDEWLKLKRTCPLCKCDIAYRRRGSKLWSRRSNGRGHGRQRSSGSRRFSFGPRRTTQ